jgi:hypothetical protein
MEHGIHVSRRNERHRLARGMPPEFQDRGGGLAHQRERPVGEPSADQADHLMRPHPDGRVPLAQRFTDVGRRRQHTHERQRPALRASRAAFPPPPSRSRAPLGCSPTVSGEKERGLDPVLVC